MLLSKYFTEEECQCRGELCCSHSAPMNPVILMIADAIREEVGEPVECNSGFRCKTYNRTIEGASETSMHTRGLAMDLATPYGWSAEEFHDLVNTYWFQNDRFMPGTHSGLTGLGFYDWGVHCDIGPITELNRPIRWGIGFE